MKTQGIGMYVQLENKLPYASQESIKERLLAITEEEWNEYIKAWYKLEASFRAWKQERGK